MNSRLTAPCQNAILSHRPPGLCLVASWRGVRLLKNFLASAVGRVKLYSIVVRMEYETIQNSCAG